MDRDKDFPVIVNPNGITQTVWGPKMDVDSQEAPTKDQNANWEERKRAWRLRTQFVHGDI